MAPFCSVLVACKLENGIALVEQTPAITENTLRIRLPKKYLANSATAQLVEQASVLDGDNSLVGEGGGQLDLPLGEWTHGFALYDDDPDWSPFAQKWHTKEGTKAANPLAVKVRIFGIS